MPSFLFWLILNRKTSRLHCDCIFSNLKDLPGLDGGASSLLYESWTCGVFQFKSIIKPAPISTAIKLSEPQINLADREILLQYSDQYCSPGLEGEQGTLKAFGSASSLGGEKSTTPGLSILKSWWRRSATERRGSIEHTELFTAEARVEQCNWQVIDTDNLTLYQGLGGSGSQPHRPKQRDVCKTWGWEVFYSHPAATPMASVIY